MLHLLAIAIPLAAGVTIALLAARRGWAPRLRTAVAAGTALRLFVAVISVRDTWQPSDFMYQFTAAIRAILRHQDPLRLPNGQWHFLPAMAYVNVGASRLGELTHVPWQLIGRVVPVGADIALILLVGALAGTGRRRRAAAFQYALNPLPIMICAIHGQVESVASALGVGALLLAMRRRPRPQLSGMLLGLSIAVNSWPALLIPGVMHALTGVRSRLSALAWACAIPLIFFFTAPVIIGYPARFLPGDAHALLAPRALIGDWGWTTLVTWGHERISPGWARFGTVILLAVLAGTWYLWRRAHPVDLTAALNLAFLVTSDRVAAQYLVWPVPYQIARPARGTQVALLLCAAWDAAGYLVLTRVHTYNDWVLMHTPWALSSLAILPFLVVAMPWKRRTARRGGATASGQQATVAASERR